jgi:mannose-6-phosphate isomerase-like protein (cupin superfamily)
VDLSELPGVDCPCGVARRAFADRQDFPGTIHLTEIHQDARTHYHRTLTEVYVVLDCDAGAAIELDGELHPVKPKTTVLIPPGTRHRAVGKMEVLIVCLPKFDPTDEHFDGGSPLSPAVGAKSTGKNPG